MCVCELVGTRDILRSLSEAVRPDQPFTPLRARRLSLSFCPKGTYLRRISDLGTAVRHFFVRSSSGYRLLSLRLCMYAGAGGRQRRSRFLSLAGHRGQETGVASPKQKGRMLLNDVGVMRIPPGRRHAGLCKGDARGRAGQGEEHQQPPNHDNGVLDSLAEL